MSCALRRWYKMVGTQYDYGLSQRYIHTDNFWKNNGNIVTKDCRDDFWHTWFLSSFRILRVSIRSHPLFWILIPICSGCTLHRLGVCMRCRYFIKRYYVGTVVLGQRKQELAREEFSWLNCGLDREHLLVARCSIRYLFPLVHDIRSCTCMVLPRRGDFFVI
jgi:hypothetical protein